MKKVLGLLGAMVFAVVLFANTDSMNMNNELNLADLASLNTADAECVPPSVSTYKRCNAFDRCSAFGNGILCY